MARSSPRPPSCSPRSPRPLAPRAALCAALVACTEISGVTDFRVGTTTTSGSGAASSSSTGGAGGDEDAGCVNGKLDEGESDVDCGGPCARCAEGKSCQAGDDCLSVNCVDGVCCETACDAPCHSCLGANTGADDGTCVPVTEGTDPGDDCPDEGAASCGKDGGCNAEGACRLYPNGAPCGATNCKTTVTQTGQSCNGAGTCGIAQDVSCLPYACSGTACKTSCATELDCAPNNYCDAPSQDCLAKKPEGSACAADEECSSEVCKAGKCRAAQCGNATQDPGETDVDCGGTCGPTCGKGQKCSSDADCDTSKTSSCTGSPSTCQ